MAGAQAGPSGPAEEEAIIRKRFRTQTVVSTQTEVPMFKKLVKKYTQLCQVLQTSSPEDAARVHEELLADLYAVQAHMARLAAAAAALRREAHLHAAKQGQLEAAIQGAAADIEARKLELEEARAEEARQREYEAAKERVMRVPPRSATRAEMAAVGREVAELAAQGAALEAAMERRRVQFAAIAHVIESVHSGLAAGAGGEDGGGGGGAGEDAPQPMQTA